MIKNYWYLFLWYMVSKNMFLFYDGTPNINIERSIFV